MKLKFSLVTRRTFLNTLFFGWMAAFFSEVFNAVLRFGFPTLGKEPDFVILDKKVFSDLEKNAVKPFPWGGVVGLYFKKPDGSAIALKGVCTHMDCNVTYKPQGRRFYCPCHQGWFDENGVNVAGPPPKPLERFVIMAEGEKLIIARQGVKVVLPAA